MSDAAIIAGHGVPRLIECPDCGLRCRLTQLPRGSVARCQRCGARLRAHSSLDASLALAITGLVLALLANFMPFMSMSMAGRIEDASLATGAVALAQDGLWPLSVLIVLLTIVAPGLKLGAIAYVLIGLRRGRPPFHIVPVLRWLDELHPWAMVEVYMLGIFVAYVRLAEQATITLGVAVYAMAALMLVMALIDAIVDYDDVWEEVERRALVTLKPVERGVPLARCEICGLVAERRHENSRCPRCGSRLHHRKANSITRCWALVITSAILYLPANIFPIMTVIRFGTGSADTILSGVKHLIQLGSWPLALLVFFASVTVPVLKIVGLSILLVTTQRRSRWHLRDRTRLYRIIEAVGQWSMIDIFMLSILVALVRLDAVATVVPGVGAITFAAVVVFTMFAAMAFDPRVMWDQAGENR